MALLSVCAYHINFHPGIVRVFEHFKYAKSIGTAWSLQHVHGVSFFVSGGIFVLTVILVTAVQPLTARIISNFTMEIHWIFAVFVIQVALRTAFCGLDRGDFKDAFDIIEMEEAKNIDHEGEEMRIIEDPDEIDIIKLKQLKTDENGDVREQFVPLPIPTDFDSYDVDRDGFISLMELIKVTGAKENSEQAFNDSDTNSKYNHE